MKVWYFWYYLCLIEKEVYFLDLIMFVNFYVYFVVDCWDGKDGEFVIYYGYMMMLKVKFCYVIFNINDFVFFYNK